MIPVPPAETATHAPTRPLGQTFAELLCSLYQDEYTGILVLHLANGVPKVAEIPEKIVARRQVRLR